MCERTAQREDIGEAVAAGDPLRRDRKVHGIGLHPVDHAVDGGRVGGRALDLDPGADAVDEGFEVEFT